MSITVNGLRTVSTRFLLPWSGAWVADIELDLDNLAQLPNGAVTIIVNDEPYSATIDPRASGTFQNRAFIRAVGGGGKWDTFLPGQHFNRPEGLTSTDVYSQTAALLGESVIDPSPVAYGADYVRSPGVASRIFGDRDWYVSPSGVTTVQSWPAADLIDGATIVDIDINQQRVTVNSDSVVLPGTVLTDDRFNGVTYIVREVEHVFSAEGNRALLWCAALPVSRLKQVFTSLVREAAQTQYLRTYVYRFVLANPDGTLALQGVTDGAPDLNPISQWTGLSGGKAKIAPSTQIIVGFAGGDPSIPYLVSFSSLSTPLELDLAGGASFLVVAPWAAGLAAALAAMAASLITAGVGPLAPLAAIGTTLQTALGVLPPPATTLVKGA